MLSNDKYSIMAAASLRSIISGDCFVYLRTGSSPGDSLGDAQETTARIFLQVQIVASVILEHHFALQFTIFWYVVGVRGAQRGIIVAEGGQVVAELGGRRQGQKNLGPPPVRADLQAESKTKKKHERLCRNTICLVDS